MLASDNASPACPELIQRIQEINEGHAYGYGQDAISEEAERLVAGLFGLRQEDILLAFVPNGTAANVIGLSTFLRSWDAVLCTQEAHINMDECGALEALRGIKLIKLPGKDGKIHPEALGPYHSGEDFIHTSRPAALSITQSTELGTVYQPEELAALGKECRERGLLFHLDGARISNSISSLLGDSTLPATSSLDRARMLLRKTSIEAGVSVLSLGMTKNGGLFGELLLVFPANLPAWARGGEASPWKELRLQLQRSQKQALGLLSKNRYLAAQVLAMFEGDLWLRNASWANAGAHRLAAEIEALIAESGEYHRPAAEMKIMHPVQANGLWLRLPGQWIPELQERFGFYVWDKAESVVRLMSSWDSREDELEAFVGCLRRLLRT